MSINEPLWCYVVANGNKIMFYSVGENKIT